MIQQDSFSPEETRRYIKLFKESIYHGIFIRNPQDRLTPSNLLELLTTANSISFFISGKSPDRIFNPKNNPLARYFLSRALYLLEKEERIIFISNGTYQFKNL